MMGSDVRALLKSNLSVQIIVFCSFFVTFSSFALIPFIPIILSLKAAWSTSSIGILLAIMSFVKFSGSFFAAILLKKVNVKISMLIGLVLQIIGFVLLLIGEYDRVIIWISVLQIAFGESIYMSANKVYLVCSVSEDVRHKILAISSSFTNTGILIGPILGGALAVSNTDMLFGVTIIVLCFVFFLQLTLVRRLNVNTRPKQSLEKKSHHISSNILVLCIIQVLGSYIYFFFQNYIGVFLLKSYSSSFYSVILFINSLIIIVFQYLLSEFINRANLTLLIFFIFVAFAGGFVILSSNSVVLILLGTVIIAFAEFFLFFKVELKLIDLSRNTAVGYGYFRLSMAVGAFFSNMLGGILFQYFDQIGEIKYFWYCISIQSFIFAIISFIMLFSTEFKKFFSKSFFISIKKK